MTNEERFVIVRTGYAPYPADQACPGHRMTGHEDLGERFVGTYDRVLDAFAPNVCKGIDRIRKDPVVQCAPYYWGTPYGLIEFLDDSGRPL